MIELTEEQRHSIQQGIPVRLSDHGRDYVLLRSDIYDELVEGRDDTGPWQAEELDQLREESVALLDRCGKV